jgi:hypothetical protein
MQQSTGDLGDILHGHLRTFIVSHFAIVRSGT